MWDVIQNNKKPYAKIKSFSPLDMFYLFVNIVNISTNWRSYHRRRSWFIMVTARVFRGNVMLAEVHMA